VDQLKENNVYKFKKYTKIEKKKSIDDIIEKVQKS